MSVKSEISQGYLESQHVFHGHKLIQKPTRALITGDSKSGSIGEAIREIIEAQGDTCESLQGDVRDPYTFGSTDMGQFNTLIMCHGVMHLDWFENAPLDKVKEIFDVNLFGTYACACEFVNATVEDDWRKTIIIIGSMAHKAVLNGSAAYCASKAGVAHLARCMAWELAPKGFDVYCIHPSNTLGTPMSEDTIAGLMRYRHMTRDDATLYWNDSQVRKQSLTTNEIAELVSYLLTGKAQYLSGGQLELAGGQR